MESSVKKGEGKGKGKTKKKRKKRKKKGQAVQAEAEVGLRLDSRTGRVGEAEAEEKEASRGNLKVALETIVLDGDSGKPETNHVGAGSPPEHVEESSANRAESANRVESLSDPEPPAHVEEPSANRVESEDPEPLAHVEEPEPSAIMRTPLPSRISTGSVLPPVVEEKEISQKPKCLKPKNQNVSAESTTATTLPPPIRLRHPSHPLSRAGSRPDDATCRTLQSERHKECKRSGPHQHERQEA